jgi:hypothetical protein
MIKYDNWRQVKLVDFGNFQLPYYYQGGPLSQRMPYGSDKFRPPTFLAKDPKLLEHDIKIFKAHPAALLAEKSKKFEPGPKNESGREAGYVLCIDEELLWKGN